MSEALALISIAEVFVTSGAGVGCRPSAGVRGLGESMKKPKWLVSKFMSKSKSGGMSMLKPSNAVSVAVSLEKA
jgi:hypothetical protein